MLITYLLLILSSKNTILFKNNILRLPFSTFSGPRHRQRFLCEVRVEGIPYIGAGNSTTKKDAQVNASKDFVNYLVRSGAVPQSEVPGNPGVKTEVDDVSSHTGHGSQEMGGSQRPVFQVFK